MGEFKIIVMEVDWGKATKYCNKVDCDKCPIKFKCYTTAPYAEVEVTLEEWKNIKGSRLPL